MLGKFTNMNFDFICKISLEICKMGITFAYELGLKSLYMKKHLLEKLHPKPNKKKKLRAFQGLEAKKFKTFQKKVVLNFFNCFRKMIRNMTGKYFSKFHNSHEHEQSPRHQQGIIGLIC